MNKDRQRKRGRRLLTSGLAAVLSAGFLTSSGCGSVDTGAQSNTEAKTQKESQKDDEIQIGFSTDSYVLERWIRDRDMFVAAARELGAEVNVQDASGEAQEQISQIEYFIDKQMDVIAVIARDCNALSGVIEKARNAGIPTISYDRLISDADTDLYISFDNRKVGELMAQSLEEAIPDGGEIFMIQGSLADNNVKDVQEGFTHIIENSNLDVVYNAYCDGWMADLAVDYVEEALEEHPDVKGIMCGNDDIASRVIQVLAENQLAGKVAVVGQDGDLAACQRIVEGTQYMTVYKSIEDIARLAAEYSVFMGRTKREIKAADWEELFQGAAAFSGENGETVTLEPLEETVNDGSYEVPAYFLEPVAVTRENIDEVIIDGGVHRRDEVYLNADYQ